MTDFADELGHPSRPRIRMLDTRRMVQTPPPPIEWLADGVFARGKFTLFGGREKGGKSLIQMAIAFAMVSGGGTVAGIDVAAGRVLINDGENGEGELHRRIHGLDLALEHADDLLIGELQAFDLRYHLDDIVAQIDEYEPDLVLLDSFRALWRGSERDEEEIASALYPLAELAHQRNVAIGLTHHATKGDSSDYRGSTAIGAVPDWVCVLSRNREDPDQMRRRLATPYTRFAPPRDDRWLRICSEGDDGPVWLEEREAFVPEHDAPVRDALEAALRAFIEEGLRGCGDPKGDHNTTTPSWTGADLARAVGRDKANWSVREALKHLAADGVIYRGDDQRWHPQTVLFHRNGDS